MTIFLNCFSWLNMLEWNYWVMRFSFVGNYQIFIESVPFYILFINIWCFQFHMPMLLHIGLYIHLFPTGCFLRLEDLKFGPTIDDYTMAYY